MRGHIHALMQALFAFEQPVLQYCARCAGHYPPDHFPCG
jgi:hypothetical protein